MVAELFPGLLTARELRPVPAREPATGPVAAGPVAAGPGVLPVAECLAGLFPDGGLRRGQVVSVADAPALVLALLAEASAAGSWCAELGTPLLGSAAAAEAGVALDRFVRVPEPGERWAEVAAALIDGFDIVVVHPTSRAGAAGAPGRGRTEFGIDRDRRRLAARARERGTVLLATGASVSAASGWNGDRNSDWNGAALRLAVVGRRWYGVGAGHGRLTGARAQIRATGRGSAARPRTVTVWLPGRDGRVRAAEPAAVPVASGASRPALEPVLEPVLEPARQVTRRAG